MAKYYNRINTRRMAELLDLSQEVKKCLIKVKIENFNNFSYKTYSKETEEFLSNLVVNKTIHAKIDRLIGVVTFEKKRDPNDVLNDWSNNLNLLMNTINKTTHLINKEEMVHAVKS